MARSRQRVRQISGDHRATRVLFLNSCVNGGGAGRSLAALLSVPQEGMESWVVMPEPGVVAAHLRGVAHIEYVPEFVERLGRSPYAWPDRLRMQWLHGPASAYALALATRKIIALARRIKPDVIHCNHMLAKPIGTMVGAAVGIPVVFHSRAVHQIPIDGAFYSWLGARKAVSRIICNSAASAEVYRRRSAEKITIIPNSIDVSVFSRRQTAPRLRLECGLAADDFVVGFVGRLHPKKGLDWLLRSFASLCRGHRNSVLVVLGDNDGGLHYDAGKGSRDLAAALGIGERVIFTGFRDDVRPYMADFDVLAFPSRLPESFGRVILEAMALEVPVVVAAHGGAIEVVEDGRQGLWVEVEDEPGLADALEQLAKDAELRRRMGRAGRERVAALYDVAPVARRVFGVLANAAPDCGPLRRSLPASEG